MPGQFKVKNGLIVDSGGIQVTGSISSTAGITGSFSGSIAGFPTDVAGFSASLSSRIASNEAKTGSFATTGSNQFNGSQTVTGSLTATGTIVAQTLVVQTITSSVDFVTGSTRFGSTTGNTHEFTGSVLVTGSQSITGGHTVSGDSLVNSVSYLGGQNTLQSTDQPHLFRINGGGLGISANNEGTGHQPIHLYTAGTIRFTVSGSGNIGIGTTNPGYKLEIQTNVSASALWVQTGGTTSGHYIADFRTGTNASALQLLGNANASFGGNVGIGTNAPTLALSVIGQVRAGYATGAGLTIGLSPIGVPNNDLNAYVIWGDAASFGGNNGDLIYIPRSSTTGEHRFYTANTGLASEKMRITFDGKVGIGRTVPEFTLDVNGDIAFNRTNKLMFAGGVAGDRSRSHLTGDGNNNIFVYGPSSNLIATFAYTGYTSLSGLLDFQGSNTIGSANDKFNLGVNGTSYAWIQSFGGRALVLQGVGNNVGIGLTQPQSQLHINGDFTLTESGFDTVRKHQIAHSHSDGNSANNNIRFLVSNGSGTTAERMRINGAGNVGIGITSLGHRFTIADIGSLISGGNADTSSTTKGIMVENTNNGDESIGIWFRTGGNHTSGISGQRDDNTQGWGTDLRFYTHERTTNDLSTTRERMRITPGGDLLVGQKTSSLTDNGWQLLATGGGHTAFAINNNEAFIFNNRNSGTTYQIDFRTAAVERGSITVGDSSVSFNTTSDYRLKQDLKSFNGISMLDQINVYDFEWKINNTRSYGVIAHELQEVLPYSVYGEKDGAKFQQVDYSKIVPVLIQSIKELSVKVAALEAQQ